MKRSRSACSVAAGRGGGRLGLVRLRIVALGLRLIV
jgi:hypothetical protein